MTKHPSLHNSVAPRITAEFISAMVAGKADATEVMVALESIVLGALLANEGIFGTPRRLSAENLDMLASNVSERLAERSPGQERKDFEHG